MLDFSKIEAGRLEIEVLDFDPRRLVEDAADIVAPQAHAKGLELVTLVAPEVPQVACGDPGRLRQVLLNLVGNAVKFTEEGEVVSTWASRTPRRTAWWCASRWRTPAWG